MARLVNKKFRPMFSYFNVWIYVQSFFNFSDFLLFLNLLAILRWIPQFILLYRWKTEFWSTDLRNCFHFLHFIVSRIQYFSLQIVWLFKEKNYIHMNEFLQVWLSKLNKNEKNLNKFISLRPDSNAGPNDIHKYDACQYITL